MDLLLSPSCPPTPSTSLSHSLSHKSTSSAAASRAVIFGLSFLHLDRTNSNRNKSPRISQSNYYHPSHQTQRHRPMRRRESSRVRKIRRRYSTSSTDPDELNKLRLQLLLLDRDHAEGSTALSFDQQAEKADARETSAGSSTFFYDTTSTVASPTSDTNPLVSDTTDTKMPRSFQVQRLDGAALGAVQPPTRANTNTTVPPTESKSSAARNRVGHRQFPSYGQHEVFIESTHKNPIVSKRSSSTPPILSRLGRQRKYNDSRCNQRAPSTATASSINGRLSRESELRSRLGPFDSHTSPPSGGRWMIGHEIKNGELTREEFEALPVAIRRKYFSTLERLRFAQKSADIPPPSELQIFEENTAQNIKRRKKAANRASRFASDSFADKLAKRRSLHGSQLPTCDSAWFANLPDKIKKRHFSKDEQIALSRQHRESVILDAADEAVYKIGRRASKHLASPAYTPSLVTPRDSMESTDSERRDNEPKHQDSPENFMDSFRWLDEDEDLDLKLFLDDYHANLREALPQPKTPRRPSFRRHLSITKAPFGRSSLSSSRPGTKENGASMPPNMNFSPSPSPRVGTFQHEALPKGPKLTRRSRTLSLISNHNNKKNAPSDSMIDPEAAHYQDPEARLKLRVYLASPQKFDEAVEFGFPSKDGISARPNKEIQNHKRRDSKPLGVENKENENDNMRTFLEDDRSSIYSEDVSMADPDSPMTPQTPEKTQPVTKPVQVASESANPTDTYAQAPAASREMTLRMTLTRPDLRACEDQIYGWQNMGGRKSTTLKPEQFAAVTYLGPEQKGSKQSMEQVFASMDSEQQYAAERGVMKRFWDRVRHH